jgi:hypothetical protein
MQRTHFRYIITGDESWFYLEYQNASQWSVSRDEVPQKVDPAIGTAKFIFTAIWDVNGFHLLDLMPSQCRFNTQYFMEHVMTPLVQTIVPQGRTQQISQCRRMVCPNRGNAGWYWTSKSSQRRTLRVRKLNCPSTVS